MEVDPIEFKGAAWGISVCEVGAKFFFYNNFFHVHEKDRTLIYCEVKSRYVIRKIKFLWFEEIVLFFYSEMDPHVRDCVRSYTEDWAIVNRK